MGAPATPVATGTSVDRLPPALALFAGAAIVEVLVGLESVAFFWTPLLLGLTFLGTALAGGRRGAFWAPACMLTCVGLGVAYVGAARPAVDVAAAYLVAAGAGVLVAGALHRRGFQVELANVGAALLAFALAFLESGSFGGVLARGETYAALLALLGLSVLLRRSRTADLAPV